MAGSRSDQYAVTVTMDGTDLGVWDTCDGGAATSEETKYNPGGMASQITLGGRSSIDNVTVARLFDLDRDAPLIKNWMNRVGRAKVVVNKQPLDADGNTYGPAIVYSGKLMTVTPPSHDSESNDAARVELEISTDGTIA